MHEKIELQMPETFELKIRRFNKDYTLTVIFEQTTELKMRFWIANRLVRLAAWVLGCGLVENGVKC